MSGEHDVDSDPDIYQHCSADFHQNEPLLSWAAADPGAGSNVHFRYTVGCVLHCHASHPAIVVGEFACSRPACSELEVGMKLWFCKLPEHGIAI